MTDNKQETREILQKTIQPPESTQKTQQLHPRKGVKRGFYLLPNLFTTGNLFMGFASIIFTFNSQYRDAAIFIVIAQIFDILDGKIARYTKTQSKFGIEYDSLADLIAFGAAPALLVYSWALLSWGRWGWLAVFLYLACGALRLARFNIKTEDTPSSFFFGLPIPGAAGLMATLVLFIDYLDELKGVSKTHRDIMMLLMVYLLAALMVSNIQYPSFKKFNLLKKVPFYTYPLVIIAIVIIVQRPEITLFTLAVAYVLSGLVLFARRMILKSRGVPVKPEKETVQDVDIDVHVQEEEEEA